MNEWYDSWDQWVDEERCPVCAGMMGQSDEYVCSATCADILARRSENDCYA